MAINWTGLLNALITRTAYTGGGAGALDALATVSTSLPIGAIAMVVSGTSISFHKLRAGTDAENSPTIVRGDDYAGGTNERVWELLGIYQLNGLKRLFTATAALDFPSIAAAGQQDLTINVPGAVVGDAVELGLPAAPDAGLVYNAFVSAADTVTVRATNVTAGAIDPASATFRVKVSQF